MTEIEQAVSIEVTQADREAANKAQLNAIMRVGSMHEAFAHHRQQAVAAEVAQIVAWLREQASWHDKYDDGLSGFDRIAQAHRESIEAIERGEYKETSA